MNTNTIKITEELQIEKQLGSLNLTQNINELHELENKIAIAEHGTEAFAG